MSEEKKLSKAEEKKADDKKKRIAAKEAEEKAEKAKVEQEEADAKASMAAKGDTAVLPHSGKNIYILKKGEKKVIIENMKELKKYQDDGKLVGWNPMTEVAIVKE